MAMKRSEVVQVEVFLRLLVLLGAFFWPASGKTCYYVFKRSEVVQVELFLRVLVLLGAFFWPGSGKTYYCFFKVKDANYTRLCSTKSILTVNGQFPGPTLYAHKGDRLVVDVYNHASTDKITLHWHGVKQPRNPWSDGPEYITQCAIQPGKKFRYTVILSDEEGTLWWHAHSEWSRATVHGAIVIYPKRKHCYPFPIPHNEFLLILGEWWKQDIKEVYTQALLSNEIPSDAFTINGQPGDLYPCSKSGTYRMVVEHGKRYLLRIINAGMRNGLFFSIADHQLTVIGSDASYTKPLTSSYILIAPGETMDVLLEANQRPNKLYYMAARALSYQVAGAFDNTTTTAILQYAATRCRPSSKPVFPFLPNYTDTSAAHRFVTSLRSLAHKNHPIDVPRRIDRRLIIAVAVNRNNNGTTLAASLNNVSFHDPSIDILQAYYKGIKGVFKPNFPLKPRVRYNYTADVQPPSLLPTRSATKVRVFEYGEKVEVVYQGTSLVMAEDHPMHLHGLSFYVVGSGFGNFDVKRDPFKYNYIDPPRKNTISVPRNGWAAIRFEAKNPGVWYLHCHFDVHLSWGMTTVFIVKNGVKPSAEMLPPPPHMPPCTTYK